MSTSLSAPVSFPPGTAERARWAVTGLFFVHGGVFGIWAAQIPLVKDRLSLSPEVLGTTLLCLAVGALLAMTGAGALGHRMGSATLARIGGALFCLFLPLPALVPGVWSLAAALFLLGAAGGVMDVAMNTHGAQVESELGRPIMSSLHGMWSLGGLIGAGAGGALLAVLSPLQQVGTAAAVLVVMLLVVQAWLLPVRAARAARSGGGWRPVPGTLLLGVLTMLAFMSEGAVLDWSAIYLRDGLGGAAEMAGLAFAGFSGTMALGRFLGDGLRRRYGGLRLLWLGGLLAAGGLALALTMPHPVPAAAAFALAGLGLSNVVPVLLSAAGRCHPADAPRAIATVATLGYVGVLMGPALFGYVAGFLSVAAAFAMIAVLCAVISLLSRWTAPWVGS